MQRREGIAALVRRLSNEPVIANLGPATFDLYAAGDRDANLYTWGAMGAVVVHRAGRCARSTGPQGVRHRRRRLAADEPRLARDDSAGRRRRTWCTSCGITACGMRRAASRRTRRRARTSRGIALAAGIRNVAQERGRVEAFEEALDRAIREPGAMVHPRRHRGDGRASAAPQRSSGREPREVPSYVHRPYRESLSERQKREPPWPGGSLCSLVLPDQRLRVEGEEELVGVRAKPDGVHLRLALERDV